MFKRINSNLLVLIIYILLAVLYFLPVLRTTLFCHQDRFIFYGWDIVDGFYHQKLLIKKALSSDVIPWWNPFVHNGIPIFGGSSESFFYPVSLLFSILPLIPLFTISLIFHTILIGFGMFLLTRAFKLTMRASFMSGVVFMFCGFYYSKICTGHLFQMYTSIWFLYYFYAFEKARCAVSGKDLYKFILLGSIFVALGVLAGHFQFLYMGIVVVGFYMLFVSIWNWIDKGKINFKPFNIFALMILFGICLSAIHFVPAIVDLNLANRSFGFIGEDTSWPVVSGFPFPPKDVITMLVPHFLNKVHYEDAAYLGILPLFFSFGLLVLLSKLDLYNKRRIIFFFILAMLGLFFSFGNQFPFFAIQYYIPILRTIRVPARYLFIWHFGITLLTGYGLDSLIKGYDSTTKKRLAIFTIFLGGLFWLLVVSSKAYRTNRDLLCAQFIPLIAIGATTAIYFGLAIFSKYRRIFIWLSISLIIIDLFAYRYSGLRVLDYRGQRVFTYSDINKVIKAPEIVKMQEVINKYDGDRFFRISYEPLPIRNYGFYPLMCQGVFLYDGGATSFLARTYEAQKIALDSQGPYSPIYDLFGVKYVWSEKDLAIGNSKYEKVADNIYKNKNSLPRVFMVHRAIVFSESEDLLRNLAKPDFNPAQIALLEERRELNVNGPFKDEAEITKYNFNEVEIVTRTDKDGLLILADGYHPGWRAWIDNKKVKIFPVDWAVRGVYLPSGEHTVKFYFFPWYYKLGIGISLVSIGVFIITFIKLRRA